MNERVHQYNDKQAKNDLVDKINSGESLNTIETEFKDVKSSNEVSRNIFLTVNQNDLVVSPQQILSSSTNFSPYESSNSDEENSPRIFTSQSSLRGSELLSEQDLSMLEDNLEIVKEISPCSDQLRDSSGDDEIRIKEELITSLDHSLFKNIRSKSDTSNVTTDELIQKEHNLLKHVNEQQSYMFV